MDVEDLLGTFKNLEPPLSWDMFFISMANLNALKSKDTSTKAGCVVVSKEKSIISQGFNGLPRGVNDSIPERSIRPDKYMWYEHAERNAVYNACRMGTSLEGATIYVTNTPCSDCARAIIQSGISTVIVNGNIVEADASYRERWGKHTQVAMGMFGEAGVNTIAFDTITEVKEPLTKLLKEKGYIE